MATLTSNQIQLNYFDTEGEGFPIVLIHGWPANAESWRPVAEKLQAAGYRVIAYDRRGFGNSDHPADGYDYGTFTDDLDGLVNQLQLPTFALAGFSMGGGEVARFLGRCADKVQAAIYVGSITPDLNIEDQGNLDGALTPAAVAQMQTELAADPEQFLRQFLTNFYSIPQGDSGHLMVDEQTLEASLQVAKQADLQALSQSISTWLTDFRADLLGTQVPTLVIHGLGDQIVPFQSSGARMNEYVTAAEIITIGDGPHGLLASHPDFVADEMLEFLDRVVTKEQ